MSEYEEYVQNQIFKAKSEVKQVSAPESIEKAEAKPQLEPRNRVNEMFGRFNKGDYHFDEQTKEDQIALQKAQDETQEPVEIQGPQTIDMIFQKAKKGEL